METLKIDSLFDEKGLDYGELQNLADTLMREYCIDNGQYRYYPIEIEFYIYDKDKHPDRHVYPRNNMHSHELFFHYSGMDICFESSDGCFGGILIRALERINKDKGGKPVYFGGPLVCVNEVLNRADSKCKVDTIARPDAEQIHADPFGQRVGINALPNIEDTYYKKEYRFIRSDLNEKTTFGLRSTYDYSNNEFKEISNSYKLKKYAPKDKPKK